MSRLAPLVKRPRRTLGALATVLAAAGLTVASGADFTAPSANPANTFSTGTLSMSNSAANAAVLTASNLRPGDSSSGTVDIANTGSLSGAFTLTEQRHRQRHRQPALDQARTSTVDRLRHLRRRDRADLRRRRRQSPSTARHARQMGTTGHAVDGARHVRRERQAPLPVPRRRSTARPATTTRATARPSRSPGTPPDRSRPKTGGTGMLARRVIRVATTLLLAAGVLPRRPPGAAGARRLPALRDRQRLDDRHLRPRLGRVRRGRPGRATCRWAT